MRKFLAGVVVGWVCSDILTNISKATIGTINDKMDDFVAKGEPKITDESEDQSS